MRRVATLLIVSLGSACGTTDPHLGPTCAITGDATGIEIIAHRGFAGCYPENTLEAIEASAGYVVEIDVQMSSDGVPMLMHDSTVDRTTDGSGLVSELTAAELRALGAPTLDEALAMGARLMLDLKGGFLDVTELLAYRTEILTGNLAYARILKGAPATFTYFPEIQAPWPEITPTVDGVFLFLRDVERYPALVDSMLDAGVSLVAGTIQTAADLELVRGSGIRRALSDYPIR